MLTRAPWLWPADAASPEAGVARELAFSDAPVAVSFGSVPLLSSSTDPRGRAWGTVWLLSVGEDADADGELAAELETLWRELAAQLSRWVPLLTGHPVEVQHVATRVQRIHMSPPPDYLPQDPFPAAELLRGASFGASFALSQVSWLLELPPPSDLAASAAVARGGKLEPVGGLEEKVRALMEAVPRMRRLLVSSQQTDAESAIRAAAGTGDAVEIVRAGTLQDAIAAAYPDLARQAMLAFERRFVAGGIPTPAGIRDATTSVLDIVLESRHWLANWPPVRATARSMLERWDAHLAVVDRRMLQLVDAITRRHEGEDVAVRLFDESELAEIPVRLQLGIAAQFVQQSMDSDDMDLETARAIPLQVLNAVPTLAHEVPHFRIRGALARSTRMLALLTDDERQRADRLEQARTEQWAIVDRVRQMAQHNEGLLGELSYQISELYLLASFQPEQETTRQLHELLALEQEIGFQHGAFPAAFIALSRARCQLILEPAHHDARSVCRHLGTSQGAAPELHVQASALRWLARSQLAVGESDEARSTVALLEQVVRRAGGRADVFLLLADIERLLLGGHGDVTEDALHDRLLQLDRLSRLWGFGRCIRALEPRKALEFISRYFPY